MTSSAPPSVRIKSASNMAHMTNKQARDVGTMLGQRCKGLVNADTYDIVQFILSE